MRRIRNQILLTLLLTVSLSLIPVCSNGLESNSKKPESLALNFIKHVYSDFRSEDDNKNFDRNVTKYVSNNSDSLTQLLKDKKDLKSFDDKAFSSKEVLKSQHYSTPIVLKSNSNYLTLQIDAEYMYDEMFVGKNGNKKVSDSGIVVTYIVYLIKEDDWKVYGVQSNDLTAGLMFPEVASQDVPTYPEIFDPYKMRSKAKSTAQQYNLKSIKSERTIIGKEDIDERQSGIFNDEYSETKKSSDFTAYATSKKCGKQKAGPMRAYQDRWWKKYNPKYKYYKGNDCANYVSQVLHSGGAPFRKSGQFKWFPYDYGWINVIGLRDFLLNNTIKGPFGKKTNKLSKLTCGDLIVWRNKHAITVYKGGSSNPIITSHTAHYKGTLKKKYGTSNLTKIMVLEYYY